jgi:hypothetical protein
MYYETNSAGEIKDVSPKRIASVIEHANPAVVSVRTPCGDELTISDISIDVRLNGIHILLDCPEAERMEE